MIWQSDLTKWFNRWCRSYFLWVVCKTMTLRWNMRWKTTLKNDESPLKNDECYAKTWWFCVQKVLNIAAIPLFTLWVWLFLTISVRFCTEIDDCIPKLTIWCSQNDGICQKGPGRVERFPGQRLNLKLLSTPSIRGLEIHMGRISWTHTFLYHRHELHSRHLVGVEQRLQQPTKMRASCQAAAGTILVGLT